MDPQCVEIVGRHDASGRAFSPIAADAERRADDLFRDERIDQRATLLKVGEIRPRDLGSLRRAWSRSAQDEQSVRIGNERIWTEEDTFDPTEDRRIGAD